MEKLGLWAIGAKPNTSKPYLGHKVYPYLPRGRPNQDWVTDITYLWMRHGFLHLCAIMDWDWATRKVLNWRLSNTLTSDLCTAALKEALGRYGTPEIFNTDQGNQFTSAEFTSVLIDHRIQISMERTLALPRQHLRRTRACIDEWIYLRALGDNGIVTQLLRLVTADAQISRWEAGRNRTRSIFNTD